MTHCITPYFITLGMLIFTSIVHAHDKLYKGFKGYVNIELLSPGQLRYTIQNVQTKAKKSQKTLHRFDNKRSSLAIGRAIPVILGPDNLIVLVNNYHEYLAAKSLEDLTIPIEVKDDLRTLSRREFYNTAQSKNYIYPYDKMVNEIQLPKKGWYTWEQLKDDPNRLFASLTALKCTGDECTKDPNASELPHYPLWIKQLEKKFELAFIEFKIATLLYQAGLYYDYEWGLNPNSPQISEFTERARLVLEEAFQKGLPFSLELVQSHATLRKYTIVE